MSLPKELERIEREITLHVGTRLPDPEDIGKLVYLERFIKEVMRTVPLAHTHVRRVEKDICYEGNVLKKEDVLLLSVYGYNHDPRLWTAPDEFYPERFRTKATSELLFPFGLGTHICPGQYLAYQAITIGVVLLLQRFKIQNINKVELEPCSLVLLEPSVSQSMMLLRR